MNYWVLLALFFGLFPMANASGNLGDDGAAREPQGVISVGGSVGIEFEDEQDGVATKGGMGKFQRIFDQVPEAKEQLAKCQEAGVGTDELDNCLWNGGFAQDGSKFPGLSEQEGVAEKIVEIMKKGQSEDSTGIKQQYLGVNTRRQSSCRFRRISQGKAFKNSLCRSGRG